MKLNRKQSVFSFESYDINPDTKEISLNYKLSNGSNSHIFTEKLSFPKDKKWRKVPDNVLQSAVQAVHLAAGVSYWKAYCPKKIEVKDMVLDKVQADFWNKVYTKGLGEFFYKNKIDFRKLVSFPTYRTALTSRTTPKISTPNKSLLLFGGGKDSYVSAELLKKAGKKFDFFCMVSGRESDIIKNLIPKSAIVVRRELDPKLFELNMAGAYNGHVPISAIIAFVAQLAAILYGYRHVIASNERSANYGNTKYLGMEINHQWSKSMEFEKLVQDYSREYITPSVVYFSLLRPIYEIKIVEIFSRVGAKYFSKFASCNYNFRINKKDADEQRSKWCGHCPKCAFVFAMLSAFIPKKELVSIFGPGRAGRNLFADKALSPLFAELLGISKIKPFECVGTPEEVVYAFSKAAMGGEYSKDPIMMMFGDKVTISAEQLKMLEKDLFCPGDHLIPKEFIKIISKT